MNYDLHSHSVYSDGTLTPCELLARAAERGVDVLALTDHDETSGLAAAQTAAAERGLRFISGVEISVTWRRSTIHVLGLDIDPADSALQEGLAATRSGRIQRARRIADALEELGIHGSFDGAQHFATNPAMIARPHFARFLVQQGIVADSKIAFQRFLGGGKPAYVEHEWAGLSAAINWINGSGGIAVLAHPARYPFDTTLTRSLLSEFRDLNGAAIEISDPRPQEYKRLIEYARRYGFAVSVGSDFHSPQESYQDLGSLPPLPDGCVPVWSQFKSL